MTTTPTLPTAPADKITRDQARKLCEIVGYGLYDAHPIVSALREAHPDAGYDPNVGGGIGQIRQEHFDEATSIAARIAAEVEAARAAEVEREAAEKAAQTPAGKFARIRDAIKAGLRQTDRGEAATPEAYAQAKAAADAAREAEELRAEGEKEAKAAAKRTAKAKADAVAAAKADLPGLLPREELDQAVADARAAIDRVRALGAEHDEAIRQHWRAFAAAGFEARWGGPDDGTGIQESGVVWIEGTAYGFGAVKPWLADIKNAIHEIR